jgi:hypothetical protein
MSPEQTELEFLRLRRAGHAVALDEIFDNRNRLLSRTLHHYLSCFQCLKEGRPDVIAARNASE